MKEDDERASEGIRCHGSILLIMGDGRTQWRWQLQNADYVQLEEKLFFLLVILTVELRI